MNEVPLKQCRRCKLGFPATLEYWHRRKWAKTGLLTKDGLDLYCKTCKSEMKKQKLATDGEKIRAQKRASHYRNAEKNNARTRKWGAENKEYVREQNKAKYIRNRPERLRYSAKYQKDNPQRMTDRTNRARARRKNLPSTLKSRHWRRALEYFNYSCAVCGQRKGLWHTLAREHWIAASKGGGYTPDNIIPMCHALKGSEAGCNNLKGTKDPEAWLIERYGEKKGKQIVKKIMKYFAWVKEQDK